VRARLPRVVIATVAALLVAWFAVLARDELVGTRAADRVAANPALSRAAWIRALDDLHSADLLNPGTEFEVARAATLILHDRPAAERLAYSIVRREPANVQAWSILIAATRGRNQARFEQARRQFRRLSDAPAP
jgi:hypothetical protein